MDSIVLASGSPRRRQLLEWAEVPFTVIVSDADESFPPGINPGEASEWVALAKAQAVQNGVAYGGLSNVPPILAADTMVVLDGDVIGKPADRLDAIRILSRLSGRSHEVVTGVVILHRGHISRFHDVTTVWFHELEPKGIEHYVDRYAPYDKAGAYAIQEWIGVVGIKRIEGDFYNV
ncbi:MAG: septum formation protein Maf, partial [Chitinophagia bacterium]|nr:septum formation protein Maf [Chitinophagia bacterium]